MFGAVRRAGNGLGSGVVGEGLDARCAARIVAKTTMNIEIFSDVACPWCFIGKRRLGRALATAGVRAQLVLRAFQLKPGVPAAGVPAQSFFERKFGSAERMRAVFERVTQIGRDEGIAFDFSTQSRAPNTELCHRVI